MSTNFAIATLSTLLLFASNAAYAEDSSTSREIEDIQEHTGSKPDTTLMVIPHVVAGGGVIGTIWLRYYGKNDNSYAQTAWIDECRQRADRPDLGDLERGVPVAESQLLSAICIAT